MDPSDLCKITAIPWILCNKSIINVISSTEGEHISTAVRLVFICCAYILLPRLIRHIWVHIWQNTTLLQWSICRFLQLEMSRYPTIPKRIFRTSWYRTFCLLGITYRTLEKYTTTDRCYILLAANVLTTGILWISKHCTGTCKRQVSVIVKCSSSGW